MEILSKLVRKIGKNKYFWYISILAILPGLIFRIFGSTEKTNSLTWYAFLFIFILFIYIVYAGFKFLYEITSISEWRSDITVGNFFWLLFNFNLIFSLLFWLPLSLLFYTLVTNQQGKDLLELSIFYKRIFLIPREIIELLYILCLTVVVGTRSSVDIIKKLKELLSDENSRRIFLIYCSVSVASIFVGIFSDVFNSYLFEIISFASFLSYLILFLILVDAFQKNQFGSSELSD
ncbi:hypothetical protein EHO58_05555 [Leptospira selangorensis]|uniref:hypothetical protein n=1 Tax=Leptospira selangorensis TaxID=2484982 RepID=UPI0010825D85|nr:hypothetical protein [Leptospira selangorensis]TGK08624.1 hypothetical protein EHO58_05555 [Leptospira selangorensis]